VQEKDKWLVKMKKEFNARKKAVTPKGAKPRNNGAAAIIIAAPPPPPPRMVPSRSSMHSSTRFSAAAVSKSRGATDSAHTAPPGSVGSDDDCALEEVSPLFQSTSIAAVSTLSARLMWYCVKCKQCMATPTHDSCALKCNKLEEGVRDGQVPPGQLQDTHCLQEYRPVNKRGHNDELSDVAVLGAKQPPFDAATPTDFEEDFIEDRFDPTMYQGTKSMAATSWVEHDVKDSGGDSTDGGDPEARCIDAKQDLSATGDALQREYDLIDGLVEFMYDSPPARRQSALFFGILVEEQSLGNAAESSESGSSRSIVR